MVKRAIRINGQVQGVGFRPFVWRLANQMDLAGDVKNDAEGVLVRVSGARVQDFLDALQRQLPSLASIHSIDVQPLEFEPPMGFRIARTGSRGNETGCPPDAATCADCRAEIAATGRRAGYAFTNCTNCGPRFTILSAMPYDRAQTTMAGFDMCDECLAEYQNPGDRRFHAQPIACPACGPDLSVEPKADDPVLAVAEHLLAGKIVAIKGLGGFHVACDATNPDAIRRLRQRKNRPAKPFALMASWETICRYAAPNEAEKTLLNGADAPIVLLASHGDNLPDGIAPGQQRLGWMLPYTPLHHMLIDAAGVPLVMTSGNFSTEPQVISNDEAREKLGGIADSFLMHNRPIARRLDDGLVVNTPLAPMVIRRARGQVPLTLPLPDIEEDKQVLAYGGELKAAICLTKNGRAMLSHHLGDLDDALTYEEFLKAERDLSVLMAHKAEVIAVDMHPEYRASRYGRDKAEREGLPLIQVQHHHAHMAAALGASGWNGCQAVGLVLDGLGYGPDGTIWGGEVLVGDYRSVQRAGHLKAAPLAGGDLAQKEPWRNALVRLDAAGLSDVADRLFMDKPRRALRAAVAKGFNAPLSSSAGRLFDAVAACLGLTHGAQSFEGEAAMRLEALASKAKVNAGAYDLDAGTNDLDPGPLFHQLTSDLDAGVDHAAIAARFHRGVALSFARLAQDVAQREGAKTIALTGGCFQNSLLLAMVVEALSDFSLCGPGPVPVNDGGLAFGQALVALANVG